MRASEIAFRRLLYNHLIVSGKYDFQAVSKKIGWEPSDLKHYCTTGWRKPLSVDEFSVILGEMAAVDPQDTIKLLQCIFPNSGLTFKQRPKPTGRSLINAYADFSRMMGRLVHDVVKAEENGGTSRITPEKAEELRHLIDELRIALEDIEEGIDALPTRVDRNENQKEI